MCVRLGLSSILILWSIGAQTAAAQPVDTQAQAVRLTTGVTTVPRNERNAEGERVTDLRLLVELEYRVLTDLDLGVSVPAITVAPERNLANPWLWGVYHLMHDPIWMAFILDLELPLLINYHWRTGLYYAINIPFLNMFEWVNSFGGRVALLKPEDRYLEWASALVWKPLSYLGFGPETYLRYDRGGIDNFGVGGRIRLHITHREKTLVVFFLKMTTPDLGFELNQMTFTLVSTWFFHF